jgi:hypothetical protein
LGKINNDYSIFKNMVTDEFERISGGSDITLWSICFYFGKAS